METVRDFVILGSKITADGDCSHEIKRCLFLGRKAMTNLDSILKSIGLSSGEEEPGWDSRGMCPERTCFICDEDNGAGQG